MLIRKGFIRMNKVSVERFIKIKKEGIAVGSFKQIEK